MATQRVCDGCGEVIDEAAPFWTGSVSRAGLATDGTVPVMPSQVMVFDFHDEHLPDEIKPPPLENP